MRNYGCSAKVLNAISTAVVILTALLAIALSGVRMFGLNTYVVLTGSMEPAYPAGSLIYVQDVDYRVLKEGMAITFAIDEKTVVTHRIVEVFPDTEEPEIIRYRTKGDANEDADGGLVHCKNVIGEPIFAVPYLGYLINYVQKPPGTFVAAGAAIFLIAMSLISELLWNKKPRKTKRRIRIY